MEQREFRLHKDILWSIIRAQAGSLEKALLELTMNSIDAGATEVKISLDAQSFRVSDDGKGFTSRQEIEDFFETFGTPHKKGDATYGRFRMGRGQIMAFTRNQWRSGRFSMDVDIRDKGLAYALKEGGKAVKGCTVSGTMYEPLKPSETLTVTRHLADLCKYAPISVILNGNRISLDMEAQKWTMEDDNAYYLLKDSSSQLEVYNLGVHATTYYGGQYGTGGVVVSKRQLEVNFARNDILVSQCSVWKEIAVKLREWARRDAERKPVKNENWRTLVSTRLLSGDFDNLGKFTEALNEEKVFTDMAGRVYSAAKLLEAINRYGGRVTLSPDASNLVADKLHQSRTCFVLAPKTLERFDKDSFVDLIDGILKAFALQHGNAMYSVEIMLHLLKDAYVPFDEASAHVSAQHFPVEEAKVSKEEKVVLKALDVSQGFVVRAVSIRLGKRIPQRELRVGESETANAWTDGNRFIYINRRLLKIGGKAGAAISAFSALATLLVHEYLHQEADTGSHLHDAEFNERFEAIVCGETVIGEAIDAALRYWLKNTARKSNIGYFKELDRQAALEAVNG